MSFWTAVAGAGRGVEDGGWRDPPADGVFLGHESRLNRLAEADLVREDRPTPHVAKNPQGRSLLVLVPCDALKDGPCEEPIESVHERDPMGRPVQAPRGGAFAGRPEGSSEDVAIRIVKPQGEGGVRRSRGLPGREGHGGGIPSPATAGRTKTVPAVIIVWFASVRIQKSQSMGRSPQPPPEQCGSAAAPAGGMAGSRGC